MAKEQAKEFVEKMFNDDVFVEETVRKTGGLPNTRDESNENFILMGKAAGYDFTSEELDEALKEYANGKGFAGFRKLIHMGRLVMKVNKKVLKENGR